MFIARCKPSLFLLLKGLVFCAFVVGNIVAGQGFCFDEHGDDSSKQSTDALERIAVTGTRLKGIDNELSSPVSMLSREDIEESGANRLVDLLNNNGINLHGSRRESPGGTTQGQATINLRGLGEQRTLVLINGHRIANSAAIPDAQNINLIPLSAIERIEILKDGASSIYGADAIGGVVNIILRKQLQSHSVYLSYLQPKIAGGKGISAALYGGQSDNLFSVTYSLEHNAKSAIYAKDVNLTDEGLSQYGYPGSYRIRTFDPSTKKPLTRYLADERCPTQLNQTPYPNSTLEGGQCKYNFAQFMQLLPETESNSLFLDTQWQWGIAQSLNMHISFTQNDSLGVYAATPTVGGENFLPTMSAANLNNPTKGQLIGFDSDFDGSYDTYLNGPFDLDVYYRNVLGGLRTTDNSDKMLNFHTGLSGDVGEKHHYQLTAFYNRNSSDSLSSGLVRRDLLQNAIDSGEFDLFAVNQATNEGLAKRFVVDSSFSALFENQGASVTLNTSLFSKTNNEADTVFGLEYIKHSYGSEYDDSYQDNMIDGRAGGGSTEGTRDVWSAFTETSYDVSKPLTLNFALRYDNYSDLGDTLNPKLGLTYRYSPDLLFRASIGSGFRAPSLTELYKQAQQSFRYLRDYKRCNASGDLDQNGQADNEQNSQQLAHNHPC